MKCAKKTLCKENLTSIESKESSNDGSSLDLHMSAPEQEITNNDVVGAKGENGTSNQQAVKALLSACSEEDTNTQKDGRSR